MNFLDRFLKSKATVIPAYSPEPQAVLIYIEGEDLEGSIPVQYALIDRLKDESVGMFDGNEVGGGKTVLFLYGPDAELLYQHIEPVLRADPFCRGAKAVIRWGSPGAPQREVILSSFEQVGKGEYHDR